MKVILLNHIEKVGKKGEVINVKSGYARNYLIPRNYALYATPQNMKKLGSIQAKAAEEEERLMAELKKLDAKIRGLTLNFVRKVDANDHMFGSVSETDIVAALADHGVTVHKSLLAMDKHIKNLGESLVPVRLHKDLVSEIKILVDKEHVEKETPEPAVEEPIAEPSPLEPATEDLPDTDLDDEL